MPCEVAGVTVSVGRSALTGCSIQPFIHPCIHPSTQHPSIHSTSVHPGTHPPNQRTIHRNPSNHPSNQLNSMSVPFPFPIHRSVCPSIHPSNHQTIQPSIRTIHPAKHPSINLSDRPSPNMQPSTHPSPPIQSIHPPTHPSTQPSIQASNQPSIQPSIAFHSVLFPSVHPSMHPSLHPSIESNEWSNHPSPFHSVPSHPSIHPCNNFRTSKGPEPQTRTLRLQIAAVGGTGPRAQQPRQQLRLRLQALARPLSPTCHEPVPKLCRLKPGVGLLGFLSLPRSGLAKKKHQTRLLLATKMARARKVTKVRDGAQGVSFLVILEKEHKKVGRKRKKRIQETVHEEIPRSQSVSRTQRKLWHD